ncbi:MAG: glutamine--fructose-6-phosphate transaminase (isomerizing) [Acidimicrobiales bacterium]
MCGIIGATGGGEVLDVLLDGLARLEYRGYDSAGVALQSDGALWRARAATGTRSLEDLRKVVEDGPPEVTAGIGHTRWATHGHPTEANAHPILDCTGTVAVVHNGIIENWRDLAARLRAEGHTLVSDTDTEVIAHLVEDELSGGASIAEAVRGALRQMRGAFALAVVCAGEPGTIVAGRRVSPLIIGMGEGEHAQALLASDIPALLGRTKRFWVLDDDQIVELRPGSMRVTTLAGKEVEPNELHVTWDLEAAEKGGFPDFMGKEIDEQPRAVADTLSGRLLADGTLDLDELRITDDELRHVDKVFVVACGSSYHAGMVAKYAIEHWTRLPTEIDIASEFRYRDPVLDSRTLVVGVSQSGETIDTLQAMREARQGEAKVMVISNVVDSSMPREADGVLYTRAGPEVGVAATKTHLTQVVALELLALYLAQLRGTLAPADVRTLFADLEKTPDLLEQILAPERAAAAGGPMSPVATVAARFAETRDFFFLGRHVGFPVALEGALKLKEISYVRAEGYPAGELKHGPIALIEPGTVVVGVATRTELWEKMMGNVAEVRARGATVVLVANEGDDDTAAQADEVLWVPSTHKLFAPVLDVVPLQLLAYHIARLRGHDVDRPRNLAKTVTVE